MNSKFSNPLARKTGKDPIQHSLVKTDKSFKLFFISEKNQATIFVQNFFQTFLFPFLVFTQIFLNEVVFFTDRKIPVLLLGKLLDFVLGTYETILS
jgi:hypothetical protein